MNYRAHWPFVDRGDQVALHRPPASPPGPFALLHRPESAAGPQAIEVLSGDDVATSWLADLPLATTSAPHDLLAVVPYRQISERGFDCRDDRAPVLAMKVTKHGTLPVAAAITQIADVPIALERPGFDLSDQAYAATVTRILSEEIGGGAGSNFVIKRTFNADIPDFSLGHALSIFRRLLTSERGAYWTFLVHVGDRTFIGASPERHVSLASGVVTMNPISGTYRYPRSGPSLPEVLSFLSDRKEADELYMVVDEELKMMARICEADVQVNGPYLKEMGKLAHTEYLITGRSSCDIRQILRETMFAPTVTGSPLENACRVIARHEPAGRGYYGGALALAGSDRADRPALDASILIRTAEIDDSGHLALGVGGTLVRLSDPDSEVAETRAKARAMLAALGADDSADNGPDSAPPAGEQNLGRHPGVREALARRNSTLAHYWLSQDDRRRPELPQLRGRRILVVDAEDTFTAMLAQHLGTLGLEVSVTGYDQVPARCDADLVVVGPGPGDPRDGGDDRIAALRAITRRLIADRTPFLSVCLGHQVLSWLLGLKVIGLDQPNQGVQREVDLFGRKEQVGLYNTFTALCGRQRIRRASPLGTIEVSRDRGTGEVYALRGNHFASVQFHPESLLTQNGSDILARLLLPLLGTQEEAGRKSVYDDFAGPRLDPGHWNLVEVKDADGIAHEYSDPNAMVRTGNGQLEVTVNPFTRFHDRVPMLNNAKQMYISAEPIGLDRGCETTFETTMAVQTYGQIPFDLLDAFGTVNLVDFATATVLQFAATNDTVYAVAERLVLPGVTEPDDHFAHRIVLDIATGPRQQHRYSISYDPGTSQATWLVDGARLYWATTPVPVQGFHLGMGLFSARDLRRYPREQREHGQGASGYWGPWCITQTTKRNTK
jgi:2-amino-4-deoxychorismate synthase